MRIYIHVYKRKKDICLVIRLLCPHIPTSRFCLNTRIMYQNYFKYEKYV